MFIIRPATIFKPWKNTTKRWSHLSNIALRRCFLDGLGRSVDMSGQRSPWEHLNPKHKLPEMPAKNTPRPAQHSKLNLQSSMCWHMLLCCSIAGPEPVTSTSTANTARQYGHICILSSKAECPGSKAHECSYIAQPAAAGTAQQGHLNREPEKGFGDTCCCDM